MEIRNSTGHVVTLDDTAMTIAIGDDHGDAIVFDAKKRILTVDVRDGVTITVASGSVTINAPAGVTINSGSVVLGDSSAVALVKESLIDIFNDHRHLDQHGVLTAKPNLTGSKGVNSTTKARGA
jgi:hypothetical protein